MMGKQKPWPWRLNLRANDISKLNVKDLIFSVAKFNNGDKIHDSQIVTSIGNNIVTWYLWDIKKGDLGKYQIKHKPTKVVDS